MRSGTNGSYYDSFNVLQTQNIFDSKTILQNMKVAALLHCGTDHKV